VLGGFSECVRGLANAGMIRGQFELDVRMRQQAQPIEARYRTYFPKVEILAPAKHRL